VNAGFVEGRQVAVVGALEADQAGDGLLRSQFRESVDFGGSASEAGAFQ
jgi:hypothetical protein